MIIVAQKWAGRKGRIFVQDVEMSMKNHERKIYV